MGRLINRFNDIRFVPKVGQAMPDETLLDPSGLEAGQSKGAKQKHVSDPSAGSTIVKPVKHPFASCFAFELHWRRRVLLQSLSAKLLE